MRQLDFSPDPLPKYRTVEILFDIAHLCWWVYLDEHRYRVDAAHIAQRDREEAIVFIGNQSPEGLRHLVDALYHTRALHPSPATGCTKIDRGSAKAVDQGSATCDKGGQTNGETERAR